MTLLIGIKCEDGLVLGADSAATLATISGQPTVRQTTRKLNIIDDCVIVGVSGAVGLAQRIRGEVERLVTQAHLLKKPSQDAIVIVRKALFENHLKGELEAAQTAAPVVGQGAHNSAIALTLIAFAPRGRQTLVTFDAQGAPEEVADIPFVALGSAQAAADHFLSFIRHVLWPNRIPTLDEGIHAIVWALDHAMRSVPGYVAPPIQVVVLTPSPTSGGGEARCVARELTAADLQERRQACTSAEAALKKFFDDLYSPPPASVPPPPTP